MKDIRYFIKGKNIWQIAQLWIKFNTPIHCDLCHQWLLYKYAIDQVALFDIKITVCKECFDVLSALGKRIKLKRYE